MTFFKQLRKRKQVCAKQAGAEQPERRRQVLQAYRERATLRGLGRIFGVARQSMLKWLADQVELLPSLV